MIIVVGGQKGGTGKTTIATNIAVMRAREGRNVCAKKCVRNSW
ncbi:hypothetical protein JKF54_06025 [Wolbachia endosymbiont of Spodoptera picta]|nr:hypothetical protein JKF54_06025 [Wolbachia endosymbiont of Spodoptera picta]